jgi:hypothetical protein
MDLSKQKPVEIDIPIEDGLFDDKKYPPAIVDDFQILVC